MKHYSKLDTCLRTGLFSTFNENKSPVLPLLPAHSCCSVCTRSCSCGASHDYPFQNECAFESGNVIEPVRNTTMEDKNAIESLLLDYHHKFFQTESDLNLPSSSITGLTGSMISDILDKLDFIGSSEYLMEHLPIVDPAVATNICSIILEYFNSERSLGSSSRKSNEEDEKYVYSDFENLSDIDIDLDTA